MKNHNFSISKILLLLAVTALAGSSKLAVADTPSATVVDNSNVQYDDPWEPLNRGTFWFNERIDLNILGPVAHGYDYITTDSMQTGVTNFFDNLKFPTLFAADILQAKFGQALTHTGRFLINSTVGILGLIDVATDMGLPAKEEDFGLVFASWGIPNGPYFVIPLMGPSTVRDTFGTVLDILTSPSYLIMHSNASDSFKFWWPYGSSAVKYVNLRNNFDDAIKSGRQGSLDYYTFQQSSYFQYRQGLESDKNEDPASQYSFKKKPNAHDDVDADLDAMLEKSKPK